MKRSDATDLCQREKQPELGVLWGDAQILKTGEDN